MEILDFFLFWHGHCKIFCSVISFSVINYVVSMRCPRVSDDSSFFLRFAQKNELKPSTPSHFVTAPVGHAEPLITVRASPRLHCIPSLQRYGLSRIALCARIVVDFLGKLDAQKNELKIPTPSHFVTAPVGHTEPSKAVRASPRLYCIPSLRLSGSCCLPADAF